MAETGHRLALLPGAVSFYEERSLVEQIIQKKTGRDE